MEAISIERFCNDHFWNSTLDWDVPNPNLSNCLRKSVLAAIPAGFSILFGILRSLQLSTESPKELDSKTSPYASTIFKVKAALVIKLILWLLIELALLLTLPDEARKLVPEIEYFSIGALLASVLIDLFLLALEQRRGEISSLYQLLFCSLLTASRLPTFKVELEEIYFKVNNGGDWFQMRFLLAHCMQFLCCLTMFALEFFADVPKGATRNPNGSEHMSSVASRLSFQWIDGLFSVGYRKDPLDLEDFPEIRHGMRVDSVLQRLRHVLGTSEGVGKGQHHPKINLMTVLFKTFYPEFLVASLARLCSDLLLLSTPLVLQVLISVVVDRGYEWKSYFWSGLLFFVSVLQVTMSNQHFHRMWIASFQARTAVLNLLYEKGLRISSSSRARYTTGEITNFMAIDAQRFCEIAPFLSIVWSAPFQISMGSLYMYNLVGISSLIGLLVLVVCIPINFASVKYGKRFQLRLLKSKDKRILMLNEILQGIRVLKLYAWEVPFLKKIFQIRDEEIRTLKKYAVIFAVNSVIYVLCPALVIIVTLGSYVLLDPENNLLTAEKIFTCMTIISILRVSMFLLPTFFLESIKLSISVRRISQFLNCADLEENSAVPKKAECINAVEFLDTNLSWEDNDGVILKNINLNFKKGSLTAILGKVGSGKSSLLSGILGEMKIISGRVATSGTISYVSQQAWIQHMTLRDNVLFGKAFEHKRYNFTLENCALVTDLNLLPAGDKTEIGENGINLSGGQKQRVSLARAAYFGADLVLLDDPLSAVDAHVGEHLFSNVIGPNGMLSNSTRILVTHNVACLPQTDRILLLEAGRVVADGTYEELISDSEAFQEYIKHIPSGDNEEASTASATSINTDSEQDPEIEKSNGDDEGKDCDDPAVPSNQTDDHALIQAETRATGRVSIRHYQHFISKMNVCAFIFILCLFLISEALLALGSIILGWWADYVSEKTGQGVTVINHNYYLWLYMGYLAAKSSVDFVRSFFFGLRFAEASRKVHKEALEAVMHSPMSFFDANPTGRIVNRFSSDIDVVDQKIPVQASDALRCFFGNTIILLIVAYNTPWIIGLFLPIFVAAAFLQIYFGRTKRQMKRLSSVNKSPIFVLFSEILQGPSVIRAFGQQDRFLRENRHRVEIHLVCTYLDHATARWLSWRVENLVNLIVLATAVFVVAFRDTMTGGTAALLITLSMGLLDKVGWMIRRFSELEADSVSVERLREYEFLQREDAWHTEDKVGVPALGAWPETGQVNFNNYSTRYKAHLDPVIRNLTLDVLSGEKLGICGRTGAGKSSLTLALFRILEPSGGKILIDGRDIQSLGLQDLRSQVTIIPQDPVLFSGTLRFNLDPTHLFSDPALWDALGHAHLATVVSNLPGQMDEPVREGGSNFSVGQRQLICLARALLRKSKILVLDEATAAMDSGTDAHIQQTLATEFADCTVITIAHRLNTIVGSDRVMVMGRGKMLECDEPKVLMRNTKSHFYKMCLNAGLVGAEED